MSRTVQNDYHVRKAFQECVDAIAHRHSGRKIRGKMYYYFGAYPLVNAQYKVAACRQAGFVATVHGTIAKFDGKRMVSQFAVYVREKERRKK